jgi:hypothetical protein
MAGETEFRWCNSTRRATLRQTSDEACSPRGTHSGWRVWRALSRQRLGVHRRLLYEKIRKLGLDAADQPLENESLNSSGDV